MREKRGRILGMMGMRPQRRPNPRTTNGDAIQAAQKTEKAHKKLRGGAHQVRQDLDVLAAVGGGHHELDLRSGGGVQGRLSSSD